MAKGRYAVIDSVARKVKKRYAVIDGVTRKIKKRYAVVGGVTKLVWSGFDKKYVWGTADWSSNNLKVASSENGSAWSSISALGDYDFNDYSPVCYGNERYIFDCESNSASTLFVSQDGLSWTSIDITSFRPSSDYTMHQIYFADGVFYLVFSGRISGYYGFRIYTSSDGYTWTKLTEFWKLTLPHEPGAHTSVDSSFMSFRFIKGTYQGGANRFVIFPLYGDNGYACPIWSDDGITFHYTYSNTSTLHIQYIGRLLKRRDGVIGIPYGECFDYSTQNYFSITDVGSVSFPSSDSDQCVHTVFQSVSDSNKLVILTNDSGTSEQKVWTVSKTGGTPTLVATFASSTFNFLNPKGTDIHYCYNGQSTRLCYVCQFDTKATLGYCINESSWTFVDRVLNSGSSVTIIGNAAIYD